MVLKKIKEYIDNKSQIHIKQLQKEVEIIKYINNFTINIEFIQADRLLFFGLFVT